MLRAFVVALLLANLAFFAWSQGWLDNVFGVRGRGDHEPERLASQVRPESIVILPPAAVSAARRAPALSCFEAGPFTPTTVAAAEAALQNVLPPGSWNSVRNEKPGTWLVYMGSFPDQAAMQRKVDEISRRRIEIEPIAVPGEGDFGLSLGRFDDRAGAERALGTLVQRGIRTARVVQLTPPTVSFMLRVEGADPIAAAQLAAARSEVLGSGFVACGNAQAAR
jgi:hypothetical protein